MVSSSMFANLRSSLWRVTPRMAVLVAWEVREKLRHKPEKCSALDAEEVKLFKSQFHRYSTDATALFTIPPPPYPVSFTSSDELSDCLPEELQLEPEHWYSDISSGHPVPYPLRSADVDQNVDAQMEVELPPDLRNMMEVQRLQEAIVALVALQTQLILNIKEEIDTADDQTANNPEDESPTEEPQLDNAPKSIAGTHFASNMPMLQLKYFHTTLRSPLPISWQSDFQGEAQRIVSVCGDFMRDCGRKTAAMGREFLDATTDEKIAAAIIKAVQDLASLMKRMAAALMEMINKILEALGIKKETIQATAVSVANVVAQVAKRGAEKCKAEAGNCQLIAKNIVNDAKGEGKKEINNIVKSLNNFGTTVSNFSGKLEKEAQMALAFTKAFLK